jgi:hypothetical protein
LESEHLPRDNRNASANGSFTITLDRPGDYLANFAKFAARFETASVKDSSVTVPARHSGFRVGMNILVDAAKSAILCDGESQASGLPP